MQKRQCKISVSMSRGTRSGRHSVAHIPSDDEEAEEPSQPAVSASDLAETKQDYTRFVFLQAIMQRGVMKESEAKQMYCELTESTSGRQTTVASYGYPPEQTGVTCALQMRGMKTSLQT